MTTNIAPVGPDLDQLHDRYFEDVVEEMIPLLTTSHARRWLGDIIDIHNAGDAAAFEILNALLDRQDEESAQSMPPTVLSATTEEIMATAMVEVILNKWENDALEYASILDTTDAHGAAKNLREVARAHRAARELVVAARNNDDATLERALSANDEEFTPIVEKSGDVLLRMLTDLRSLFGDDDGADLWGAIHFAYRTGAPIQAMAINSAQPPTQPMNRATRRQAGRKKR